MLSINSNVVSFLDKMAKKPFLDFARQDGRLLPFFGGKIKRVFDKIKSEQKNINEIT